MHEMALSESILQVLEEQARAQGFSRVRRVRLEVGVLSCVEPEALRFHFGAVTRGSLAEGAELEVLPVPAAGWCLPCYRVVEVRSLLDACPRCGGYQIEVTGGDELRVKDVEVA